MKAHPLDLHALMPRGVWKFILTSGNMKMLMTKKQKKKSSFRSGKIKDNDPA